MSPNLPQTLPGFMPAKRRGPSLSLKRDDAAQIRICLQQRNKPAVKPPVNSAGRLMLFQQSQDRQRLHHVAQRAWLEDQYLQGINVEIDVRRFTYCDRDDPPSTPVKTRISLPRFLRYITTSHTPAVPPIAAAILPPISSFAPWEYRNRAAA